MDEEPETLCTPHSQVIEHPLSPGLQQSLHMFPEPIGILVVVVEPVTVVVDEVLVVVVEKGMVVVGGAPIHVRSNLSMGKPRREVSTHLKALKESEHSQRGVPSKQLSDLLMRMVGSVTWEGSWLTTVVVVIAGYEPLLSSTL